MQTNQVITKLELVSTIDISEDERIEKILSAVDLSSEVRYEPQINITSNDNKCWHLREFFNPEEPEGRCDNLAKKRLHMTQECVKLGHRYVNSRNNANINQLCSFHFEGPGYKLQKMATGLIEDL